MNGSTHNCTKCGFEKTSDHFYSSNGRRCSWCKLCVCISRKKFRIDNSEKLKKYHAENYKKTKEHRVKRQIQYEALRVKADPIFKLRKLVRDRLRKALKRVGISKSDNFKNYIGCTPSFLKEHIESQFIGEMSWENHGSLWHIDHIIPISFYDLSTKEGIACANHFSNLRPLLAKENLSKGNRHVSR